VISMADGAARAVRKYLVPPMALGQRPRRDKNNQEIAFFALHTLAPSANSERAANARKDMPNIR
jgi:hypothetical protein